MKTEHLFEFLVLSRTLNFSQAAKKLIISQSVLSRHISELEKELDTTLFIRNTHSVVLTESGRLLVKDATELTNKYDAAISRLRLPGLKTAGTIKIACAKSAVCERLLSFIRQFRTKYSEVFLELDVMDERMLLTEPEPYDLIFTLFDRGDGKDQPVITEGALLAVPAGHRLMTKQSVSLSDLSGERIYMPYANVMFSSFARICQLAERMTGGRVTIARVSSIETALMMVELRFGLAIISAAMQSYAFPNIKIVGILQSNCDFQIFLHRNETRDNPVAKLFFEEFVDAPNQGNKYQQPRNSPINLRKK